MVTRLAVADWRAFADLRLRALTDTLGVRDPQYRQETEFTSAQWRRRLRAHAQFAATVDDQLVGVVGAQRATVESVYLYSLWLEPAARGRGIGQSLMTAAVDWARSENARVVTLRVDAANATARSVYERLGFAIAGTSNRTGELTMSLNVE